ncbi:MAG: phosphoribosyltransferase domain-containing protein [Pantoea sp.]|uniref:phosphoribosyltransferase domain-containing protein n=1 Tax=Pantoea TaxID=53335 RepID=UPI00065FDA79|nr:MULTISPECIES: phosphoribosyltransferase domain-containing protein [Pantoea]MDU7840401.1 phosphoribosyltransferase domain-containing protein [Pantoea sp.]
MTQKTQQNYQRELTGGTLSVTTTSPVSLSSLFDIAERKNPKRAFLFVSKVLGRHIPVAPSVMNDSYRQLARQIPSDLPEPVLFIGMAETAVGLAAGVFREARNNIAEPVLLTSTRHPVDGELLCEFKEDHSHATDHLIYLPEDMTLRQRASHAKTLVLIDDEATTGNTFLNLLKALRQSGLDSLQRVVTVTLTDWSRDEIARQSPLPVDTVALVKGTWRWVPRPDAPVPVMPSVNVTGRGSVPVSTRQDWGRLGMDESYCETGKSLATERGEKILVLGSGEFVWQPFLLAERLERDGADVRFSSLTRSPIAVGMAIESAIAFSDNYGLGIPNFVYNVAHQQFERVILCVETPEESVCSELLSALNRVAPRVEVLSYE